MTNKDQIRWSATNLNEFTISDLETLTGLPNKTVNDVVSKMKDTQAIEVAGYKRPSALRARPQQIYRWVPGQREVVRAAVRNAMPDPTIFQFEPVGGVDATMVKKADPFEEGAALLDYLVWKAEQPVRVVRRP